MIRAIVIALALALAACNDPTFTLRFRVTDGLAAACKNASGQQVTQCQDVPMSCAAVASIRVFNPNTPTSPFISVCQELTMAPTPTLCEIAQVNLPQPAMPVDAQTLEVEILVYPKNRLQVDHNNVSICPSMVDLGADGFPTPSLVPCLPDQPCEPSPAVGGVAFYHPGDPETVVELGCADLTLLNDPVCTGATTTVTASITDFDTLVSVPPSLASRLTVAVGQPRPVLMGTVIHNLLDTTTPLAYDSTTSTPSWTGMLDMPLATPCIEVDEDVAQSTKSVRCTESPDNDLIGTRLAKTTLDDIIAALGLPGFPDDGLVVGVVLDDHGNPAGGLPVTTTAGTVQYLSADRHGIGGLVTAPNGIFLSTDATFGATFGAMMSGQQAQAVGGLIDGKVTIVVLQIPNQTGA
ncbi:MAG: hypothetical protein ABI467_17070 [Kofleriaceae bacterium]